MGGTASTAFNESFFQYSALICWSHLVIFIFVSLKTLRLGQNELYLVSLNPLMIRLFGEYLDFFIFSFLKRHIREQFNADFEKNSCWFEPANIVFGVSQYLQYIISPRFDLVPAF